MSKDNTMSAAEYAARITVAYQKVEAERDAAEIANLNKQRIVVDADVYNELVNMLDIDPEN